MRFPFFNHVILFVLGGPFLCISCSNKVHRNKSIPTTISLTDQGRLLVGTPWKEKAIEVVYDKIQQEENQNITGQFAKTDLDDLMVFSEDGTYRFEEGKSKLRKESIDVYENGNWFIEDNKLVLTSNHSKTTYLIHKVVSDSLVLLLPVANENYHYMITYLKQ